MCNVHSKKGTSNLFQLLKDLPKLLILRKLYDFGFWHKLRWQDFAHYWPPTHHLLTSAKELLFLNNGNLQTVDIFSTTYLPRGVVPGGTMAPPNFGKSVNPFSTREGDRLCPPNNYWHPRIFRTSDGPDYLVF